MQDYSGIQTVFDIAGFESNFWGILKVVFTFVAPLLMIWAATEFGGIFLRVIRDAFSRVSSRSDDDDYDYDDSRD